MDNIEQLKQENEKLNGRLAKAVEVFKEQKATIEKLTEEIKDKDVEITNQKDALESCYMQLHDYEIMTDSLNKENAELKDSYENLGAEYQAAINCNERNNKELSVVDEKIAGYDNEIKSLQEVNDDLNKQLDNYELKLQNSEAAYDELRKKYAELKELHDGDLTRYNELEDRYEKATNELQNVVPLEDFNDEIQRLNRTISECKKSYDERVKDVADLQMKVAKLESDNDTLFKSSKEYKDAYAEAKEKLKVQEKEYKASLEESRSAYVELQQINDRNIATIESKDKAYQVLQSTYNEVFADFNELEQENNQLKTKYQARKEKQAELLGQVEELTNKLKEYDGIIEEYNQYRAFMKALQELTKTVNIEWLSPNEMTESQKTTLNEISRTEAKQKNIKKEQPQPLMNVSEMTRML